MVARIFVESSRSHRCCRFGLVHHGEAWMIEIKRLQISRGEKIRRDGGDVLGNFPVSLVGARPWLGSPYGVRVGIGILLRAFKLACKQSFSSLLYLKQLVYENFVNHEMEKEIISEVMRPSYDNGSGIERMLEESPCIAVKCEKVVKSIKKLKDSKKVVSKIMDGIVT